MGEILTGVAPGAGFVLTGVEGDYDSLHVALSGVDLRPNVDLTFKIDRAIGPDVFNETLHLTPTDKLIIHRSDQGHGPLRDRFQAEVGPADVFCVQLSATPRPLEKRTNEMTVLGGNGPQTLSFLDANGDVPSYIIDILTSEASPFGGGRISYDFSTGSC